MRFKVRYYALLFSMLIPGVLTAAQAERASAVTEPIKLAPFQPPAETSIPDNEFGKMVRLGKRIFIHTGENARNYVGNGMNCVNCHLDAGRLANSAPMWAAWVSYPAYRNKNKMVNTMEERIQGCFRYSMNGKPPPSDSKELKALMSYFYWLSTGAPTNTKLPGRGYPKLDKPAKAPDFQRGKIIFNNNCALCHGSNGEGTKVNDHYAFPPLWGKDAYNWGAGMHRINTAASFIRANMPLGKAGTLSVQDAWDVAYFLNSHERPQDPRFKGRLQQTDKQFHAHQCRYGDKVNQHILGSK